MVHVKRMNESFFAELLRELNVAGELVRARQEEKQGLLDEFDAECKRFFFGKISERSLASSVKKTNKELKRLDFEIRKNITLSKRVSERISKLASNQAPVAYKATLSGVSGGESKKKSSKKRTAPKKKVKKATKKVTKAPAKKRKTKKAPAKRKK
jgi:hypothetical protein